MRIRAKPTPLIHVMEKTFYCPPCNRCDDFYERTWEHRTHMTMSTVLTTTLTMPPPKTGSEMTGRASLTIILANRSVMRSRWPFFRIGRILSAYFLCVL